MTSPMLQSLRSRLGHPLIAIGGVMTLSWLLLALFAPLLAPFDPLKTIVPLARPMTPAPGSGMLWLGTDMLGRDILSRLIHGARSVVLYSTAATVAAYATGITLGLLAGTLRGMTDTVLTFLANVILSFPVLVLYIVIIVVVGASPLNIILAVVFSSAPAIFRIVRGLAIDVATRDFVQAARIQGESTLRIMLFDILPNTTGPLAVDFCLRIGYTAITIGTLGFLGLGMPPPTPDWGTMVNEGKAMAVAFPHLVIFPCLAISSLMLGLSLLADGIEAAAQRKGQRG